MGAHAANREILEMHRAWKGLENTRKTLRLAVFTGVTWEAWNKITEVLKIPLALIGYKLYI